MSEGREAFAKWWASQVPSSFDYTSALAGFLAARQSAGATGQEPLGYMRPDELAKARKAPYLCRVHPAKDKQSDMIPVYAAPIGDNGAKEMDGVRAALDLPKDCDYSDVVAEIERLKATSQPAESKRSSYCDTHCKKFCQNSVHGMCDGPPKDESKRVELTDKEIDAVWDSVPWKDLNVASLEHVSILRRRFARALLARAQAKGE